MIYDRRSLKELKKEIIKQIESGIELDILNIDGFVTYGDYIYEGKDENMYFEGKITKKELENTIYAGCKIKKLKNLILQIIEPEYEDEKVDVQFVVNCDLIDLYGNIEESGVVLNI